MLDLATADTECDASVIWDTKACLVKLNEANLLTQRRKSPVIGSYSVKSGWSETLAHSQSFRRQNSLAVTPGPDLCGSEDAPAPPFSPPKESVYPPPRQRIRLRGRGGP